MRRRRTAIEYHRTGLVLAENAVPNVTFWDPQNAYFLWLIHLFQLGEWEVARAYLDRGERSPLGSTCTFDELGQVVDGGHGDSCSYGWTRRSRPRYRASRLGWG